MIATEATLRFPDRFHRLIMNSPFVLETEEERETWLKIPRKEIAFEHKADGSHLVGRFVAPSGRTMSPAAITRQTIEHYQGYAPFWTGCSSPLSPELSSPRPSRASPAPDPPAARDNSVALRARRLGRRFPDPCGGGGGGAVPGPSGTAARATAGANLRRARLRSRAVRGSAGGPPAARRETAHEAAAAGVRRAGAPRTPRTAISALPAFARL